MPTLTIIEGDNLTALATLASQGARFDLVEIDGPYGAGLEAWDRLTESEYLAHYAARLPLVARCLEPWGVVFLFGYPEGCAEIKAWARATDTLYLRRWLTWYKQRTAHKGRKCETILMFMRDTPRADDGAWGAMLRTERLARGWNLKQVSAEALQRGHAQWWHRGGNLYFETGSGSAPSLQDFLILADIFSFDPRDWPAVISTAYDGLTDLDYLSASYPEDTKQLNADGLRSKPQGLYFDLFTPVVPPRSPKRALVLYGGSGNAALVAGRLGYDVTVCESDPARCEQIRRRWAGTVEGRDTTPRAELGPLFAGLDVA